MVQKGREGSCVSLANSIRASGEINKETCAPQCAAFTTGHVEGILSRIFLLARFKMYSTLLGRKKYRFYRMRRRYSIFSSIFLQPENTGRSKKLDLPSLSPRSFFTYSFDSVFLPSVLFEAVHESANQSSEWHDRTVTYRGKRLSRVAI